MCNPKFKKEHYKKRFFRPNSPIIQTASNIIKNLEGSDEEKLGQFEMIVQTEEFHRKFSDLKRKDIAVIVRLQLVGKCWWNFRTYPLRRIVAERFFKSKELENDCNIPQLQHELLSVFLHHFYSESLHE